MDKLDRYRVFLRVAELTSFIQAARSLKLPRASVSAAIQQLESSLGTRLLHRSTRQVSLTSDGVMLLERLRPLLLEAEDIEQLFLARQRQVTGRLSVDLPSRIVRRLVAPALPRLLRGHPGLELSLGSSDRPIDLIQEGVDCVVRVGAVADSNLVARPLGKVALINAASPAYLREFGTPGSSDDLDRHHCVGYASPASARALPWEYLAGGRPQLLSMSSRVTVSDAESYIACCCAGLGLIQIPRFDVQHLLDGGQLVEVLPQARAASMEVTALYPHRRHRSQRLQVFLEWFEALIKPHLDG